MGFSRVSSPPRAFLERQFAVRVDLLFEARKKTGPSGRGYLTAIMGGVELMGTDAPEEAGAFRG